MAQQTAKGNELMGTLLKSFDEGDWKWFETVETCSLICRKATTYCHLQEEACNGPHGHDRPGFDYEKWQARLERREFLLESRIKNLCLGLPLVKGERIKPDFQGDPRGATVKLIIPDGRTDDWGQTGICVPGS